MSFILLNKSILQHPHYLGERFSRVGAWIDLLLLASDQGEVEVSTRELATRWRWHRNTVKNALKEMEKDGKINLLLQKTGLKITIINYDTTCHKCTTDCTTQITETQRVTTNNVPPSVPQKKNVPQNVPPSVPPKALNFRELPDSVYHQVYQQVYHQKREKERSKEKEEKEINEVINKEKEIYKEKEKENLEKVMDLWNSICGPKDNFKKIARITHLRKSQITERLAEMGEDALGIIESSFKKMVESPQLSQRKKTSWTGGFDWFFCNDYNWVRVAEGYYDEPRYAVAKQQPKPQQPKEIKQINKNINEIWK